MFVLTPPRRIGYTAPRGLCSLKGSGLIAILPLLLLASATGESAAQVPGIAKPVFHGILGVGPARGSIDRHTGTGVITVHGWPFSLNPDSNGMQADREAILIALGDDSFVVPAGSLHSSHNGRTFTYRGPHSRGWRGVRSLQLHHDPRNAFFTVAFTVSGVDLSQLNQEDPLCRPLAVIVGDDDGFSGVVLTSPSFASRHVSIPRACDTGNSWPWLGR